MDDIPIQKIQISGPTLASLLQRFSSSPGDLQGLLFGHITHSTSSTLSDDTTTTTPSTSTNPSSTLIATITSFISTPSSSSFFFPSGNLNPSLHDLSSTLIGWFSGRRRTPLRLSLRESSITSSLSSNIQFSFPVQNSSQTLTLSPCLFLLLTTPFQDQVIHTHEYKAFQFRISTDSFEPKTLDVVNIGPAFGGHYGNFSPNSPFPMMACEVRGLNAMVEDGRGENDENLRRMKSFSKDQKELDLVAEGFEIGRLSQLMGPEASNYMAELEDLYNKMLAKLDGLARLVEKSSARVVEQENHNMKLRCKVAGLE
ncbi:unnamed protein product [Ilex paraguariensis]|uniref:Uncharacterized protein n=1 Tax=Ilex paraguariensis TaxID=185542 RepID=A0ABC8RZY6_9AQUA